MFESCRDRQFSRSFLKNSLYISGDGIDAAVTGPVAVLFVDIVGFTAPEEVVGTLREFQALMEREVFSHNGTLDDYIGDDRAGAMRDVASQELMFDAGKSRPVSALVLRPEAPHACFVFAHGAGAGMTHSFMETFAQGLSQRGIASLRYQFPYMEKSSKRPDPPAVAQVTVRAAVAKAAEAFPQLPLIAGGKSFGGRMTSQAQAAAPLTGVRGLAFVGFPLHPAGKPSTDRADHLRKIDIPMLFLQGARDTLAEAALIGPVVQRLGPRAMLHLADDADHSFHVLARSGRNDREAMNEILDAFAAWAESIAAA